MKEKYKNNPRQLMFNLKKSIYKWKYQNLSHNIEFRYFVFNTIQISYLTTIMTTI